MSELPGGVEPAQVPEPRESALGMVYRTGRDGGIELLLGRRSRKARFMPGALAFPGGRMEPSDRPDEPGAHLRCAVREFEEETGIAIPAGSWVDAGERTTPPMFPVRFHTRFFATELPAGVEVPETPPSEENEILLFLSPREIARRWWRGEIRVAPPVLAIARHLASVKIAGVEQLAVETAMANAREEDAPRIEFVRGIWVCPVHTMTMPPATHTNVWIPAGARAVVVDPGSGDPDEIDRLIRVLLRLSFEGTSTEAVVLTHHHQDHVTGAGEVARRLDVPVRAHPIVLERVADRLGGARVEPVEDGDEIDLGNLTLRAILTEGHARGHLAFHAVESNALISGDLVSALSTMLIEPGDGDMETYLASLDRAFETGADTVLPSHGPPVPAKALRNTRDHRLAREAAVVQAVAGGDRTLADIAATAYADTPAAPPFLAQRQTLAHLLRLEANGRVRRGAGDRFESI